MCQHPGVLVKSRSYKNQPLARAHGRRGSPGNTCPPVVLLEDTGPGSQRGGPTRGPWVWLLTWWFCSGALGPAPRAPQVQLTQPGGSVARSTQAGLPKV